MKVLLWHRLVGAVVVLAGGLSGTAWYGGHSPHLSKRVIFFCEQARWMKAVKVHRGLAEGHYGSDRRLPLIVRFLGDRYRLGHLPVISWRLLNVQSGLCKRGGASIAFCDQVD